MGYTIRKVCSCNSNEGLIKKMYILNSWNNYQIFKNTANDLNEYVRGYHKTNVIHEGVKLL